MRIATTAVCLLLCGVAWAGCGDRAGGDREPGIPVGSTDWPLFGRTVARTHYLPAETGLNPPLGRKWSFSDRALIEFPPALHDGVAYLADKYGDVRAIRLSDRKVLWTTPKKERTSGPPTDVTAPAYYEGRVYVACTDGTLTALDAADGRPVWERDLGSTLESSPAVTDGTVFIGTDKGIVYALDAGTGKFRWKFSAQAPVKASPSVSRGRVVFGDYDGRMYSLRTGSGRPGWITTTAAGGSAGFYSSPAIGFGRVFAGRDDGVVFAFDFNSGRRVWSFRTQGPVYGSPALAQVPGTPATVYIGSYDSSLYALDAATGRRLWSFDVGGQVPGTATVIGRTVYTSSFGTGDSIGIDVKTRRKTFSFPSPGYTPMISDGRNLYLVGYFTLHAFEPTGG